MAARKRSRGSGSGRHVVVTGAGTGIGRAIALRLAKGSRLSLLARNESRLRATARAGRDGGADSTFVRSCDIRKNTEVRAAFEAAVRKHGPVDVLVANSGIGGPNGPNGTRARDRFGDLVRTNLNGTYHCVRAAEEHLSEGPAARHIVVVSSILARIGVAQYTGYCASKAGLLGLVRALAVELAPSNVQVNAVCPGWVETDMALEGLDGMASALSISRERAHEMAMEAVPLGRMSQPEDVAGLVAWLISADARGVTGQGLDMNGGAFMQ